MSIEKKHLRESTYLTTKNRQSFKLAIQRIKISSLKRKVLGSYYFILHNRSLVSIETFLFDAIAYIQLGCQICLCWVIPPWWQQKYSSSLLVTESSSLLFSSYWLHSCWVSQCAQVWKPTSISVRCSCASVYLILTTPELSVWTENPAFSEVIRDANENNLQHLLWFILFLTPQTKKRFIFFLIAISSFHLHGSFTLKITPHAFLQDSADSLTQSIEYCHTAYCLLPCTCNCFSSSSFHT